MSVCAVNLVVVRGCGGKSVTMPVTSFTLGVFEKHLCGRLAKIEGIGNSDMIWNLQAKKG